MITKTINISLPESMLSDAKKALSLRGYASISEFIRDALRDVLYPKLTENGFTPEFEKEILEAAKEPIEDSVKWDGKTPFGEFVLTHPPKKHGKRALHRKLQHRLPKTSHKRFESHQESQPVRPVV